MFLKMSYGIFIFCPIFKHMLEITVHQLFTSFPKFFWSSDQIPNFESTNLEFSAIQKINKLALINKQFYQHLFYFHYFQLN